MVLVFVTDDRLDCFATLCCIVEGSELPHVLSNRSSSKASPLFTFELEFMDEGRVLILESGADCA